MSPATPEARLPDPGQNDLEGTVLGFDFGEKRIGVAVGVVVRDPPLRQARPLLTIAAEGNVARFAAIEKLIAEWQPARLVVGRALALDGTAHAMTARCERFANQLRGRFRLPVDYAEERLTSVAAEERLRDSGHSRRPGPQSEVDAVAAQIILEGYFDAHPH